MTLGLVAGEFGGERRRFISLLARGLRKQRVGVDREMRLMGGGDGVTLEPFAERTLPEERCGDDQGDVAAVFNPRVKLLRCRRGRDRARPSLSPTVEFGVRA